MKHLSGCEAGNFMGCSCHEIRADREAESHRKDFMRRLMSNLGGEKDRQIGTLAMAIGQIMDAAHKGSMTPAERLQDIRIILNRIGEKWDDGYDEGCGPDSQRAFDNWKAEGRKP